MEYLVLNTITNNLSQLNTVHTVFNVNVPIILSFTAPSGSYICFARVALFLKKIITLYAKKNYVNYLPSQNISENVISDVTLQGSWTTVNSIHLHFTSRSWQCKRDDFIS
jgi:hypothetical protein